MGVTLESMLTSSLNMLKALRPGRSSLGIEITDASIKMTQVSIPRGKSPEIQTYIYEELPEQWIVEGKIQQPQKLTQVLQSMVAKLDIVPKFVHFVFPSQLVMVRFLKLPDINEKDLAKLVDFEVKHHIHLPFENPLYDFVKLNGTENKKRKVKKLSSIEDADILEPARQEAAVAKENNNGGLFADLENTDQPEALQCDVMLVAAPKDMVEQYVEIFKTVGLKLSSIEIKALSLHRMLLSSRIISQQGTYILVDVNMASSDLTIFHGNELKITRNVPLAFTNTNKPTAEDASSVDALFAEFLEPDTDADFRNSCNELAHELERLMNFYRYTLNNRNQEFGSIVLSGDVKRISELVQSLKERLTIPVHLFRAADQFGSDRAFYEVYPAFAVSLGLAIRGGLNREEY